MTKLKYNEMSCGSDEPLQTLKDTGIQCEPVVDDTVLRYHNKFEELTKQVRQTPPLQKPDGTDESNE